MAPVSASKGGPALGPSWEDAIRSAYRYGYKHFERGFSKEKEDLASLHDDAAEEVIANESKYQLLVCESAANRRLWVAIDSFYDEFRSEEEYEQLQREAAVAEDIDVAFECGAHDALLQRECNPEKLSHLF
jgi:hypothetical protein